MPDPPLRRLQQLLSELFQLEHADLDFGIYRLFRIKRDEVKAFIEEQLPRSVDEAFGAAAEDQRAAAMEELANFAQALRDELGQDDILAPDGSLRDELRGAPGRTIQDLIAQYDEARAAVSDLSESEAHRVEVFNHLHAFFSRYYDDGDFVPRRRYGAHEHYAVPYNGEETYFHWANRGQHYVKSAETLRDYAFTVEGDLLAEPRRVRFVLAAASVPPGDTKGDARYFFPSPADVAWDVDTTTLAIPFEYRRPTEAETTRYGRRSLQDGILGDETMAALLEGVPDADLRAALAAPTSDDEDAPSLLLRHIRKFVRRSTSDYFVHRDLKGFLTRELEFYVKDQILHLADLVGDLGPRARTIRIFRTVAADVIEFLAQIEDVQKRLFEKRKFVLRTDYLVLLKEIPRDWWGEVVANERQLEAWENLFKVARDDIVSGGEPVSDFLAERPTLVVDTSLFDDDFRDRILERFDDLDDAIGGVLIHSENYQALRLIQPKYEGRIKCIYIDPPYNTVEGSFAYKNNYKDSSWLTMIEERVAVAKRFLSPDGVLGIAIDEAETHFLRTSIDRVFGKNNFISTIAVEVNPAGQNLRPNVPARSHDYLHLYAEDIDRVSVRPRELTAVEKQSYSLEDDKGAFYWDNLRRRGGNSRPADRPNQWYPLYVQVAPPRVSIDAFEGATEVWPIDPRGEDRIWRVQRGTAAIDAESGEISVLEKGGRIEVVKKTRLPDGRKPKTLWTDSKYSATTYGSKLLSDIVSGAEFSYPKSLHLVRDSINYWAGPGDTIMDFFGGSGTTAHAIVDLERTDGGRRRFVVAEMGRYFDSVLLTRVARVLFAPSWDRESPKELPSEEASERTPGLVKILRLESYEDALHNLASPETLAREAPRAIAHRKRLGEDHYRLRYLARLPMDASASMLSLEKLEHPFDYVLETLTEGGPVERPIDLVETFNLAAGLHVERLAWWTEDGGGGRRYHVVQARDRDERRTLVLWRDMDGLDAAAERAFLDARLAGLDPRPDRILINGDSGHPGVESLDPLFKRLMEEEERL